MKRTVRQIRRKRNHEPKLGEQAVSAPAIAEKVATEATLIQALIPIALERLIEVLKREVDTLAGPRYAHDDAVPHRVRWAVSAAQSTWGIRKSPSRCHACATAL